MKAFARFFERRKYLRVVLKKRKSELKVITMDLKMLGIYADIFAG
jgi:hypothetical protein